MFQLNHVLIVEPRWLYYVSAGSPASNWLQSNSWSLKTCCLPAGSPRRQMYFSCPLNCFGWSFALFESPLIIRVLFDSDCILLAVDINRWSLSVLFWTLNSRFLAGWFSRAGYLLSHRLGLSQEIKTWEQLFKMQRKAKFLRLITACDGIYVGKRLWPSLRDILGLRHIHHAGIFSICWQKSPFGWVMRGIMCCYLIA